MRPSHPEFVPDPSDSRAEMEALQRDVARVARFGDDFDFDPAAVSYDAAQTRLGAAGDATDDAGAPLVAGVDQAFLDDRAVSAIVVTRGGGIVERVHAVTPLEIAYVPGLLSFREGGSILAAFAELESDPDLALFDGSGRIHFREAGLATHMGVTLDVPAIGVAKSLLCGRPLEDTEGRPERWRTPVLADGDVEGPDGPLPPDTVIGYAYQSRQYDSRPVVNPLYLSPGHRVSAETATDLVAALCAGYKLPEPTRRADAYADEAKREYASDGG